MTEKNELEGQSRRTFLKTSAAVGAAATGIATVGGSAAAQQQNVNANALFGSGLIVVQGVNVQDVLDVGDVTVTILEDVDVDIDVQNVRILNNNVIKILNDVTVQNVLNQNQVTVQVSILGDIVGTDVVNVPGNLQ